MPRPKGCTCGTPVPCKLHADRASGDEAAAGGAQPEQGGAPDAAASPLPGAGKPKARKPDAAPKSRRRERSKPVAPDKPDDAALVDMLGQMLSMPAIPAALILDCEFCRDHFISEGPKAARELVALSLANPALRGALESLHAGFTQLTIAGVLAAYVAKPLMHHVAPAPILAAAGPVLGVPPRPEKPKEHVHHASSPQAEHEHPPGPGAEPPEHESDGAEAPEDQHEGAPFAGIYAA